MQTRILLVAGVAAVAGAVLVWLAAPETGIPEAAAPPVAPRSSERVPASSTSTSRPVPRPATAPAQPAASEPIIAPPPPPDPEPYAPDRTLVQPATPTGLIMAATARRPELLDCWTDYVDHADDAPSAFSIDLTITEDDGYQQLRARVPEVYDEDLEACLGDAFADARFEPLDQPALRLVWRVPTPGATEP